MTIPTSTLQAVLPIQDVLFAGETERAVNARDLWQALEIKKDYSSWIKKQIESLDLEEKVDYISFTQKVEREIGATIRKDTCLHLTQPNI